MATHASAKQYRPVHQFSGRVNKPRPTKVATKIFPRDAHLPRDANLSVQRHNHWQADGLYNPHDVHLSARRLKSFRRTEANLDGQVEAKPDAHARLTDHLARACLQAEESPQLDEQQKASTARVYPKLHGTSTSTIHSFGRRFRLYLLPFSFLILADILVRYVLFQLTRPLAQPAEWACWNLQRPAPLSALLT